MRNKLLICCLIGFIFILTGCKQYHKLNINNNDAEFVLFGDCYYYLCEIDDPKENIEIRAELKRSKEINNLGYIYEFTFSSIDLPASCMDFFNILPSRKSGVFIISDIKYLSSNSSKLLFNSL